MAKSVFPDARTKQKKVTSIHTLVFGVCVFFFFLLYQMVVIPWGVSAFVVSLFQPTGEKLTKIGFVKFDGLVWASTSMDKRDTIASKGKVEIHKDLINKDYIMDFSFVERNDKEHGYVKSANEFYVKSEVLGESAIILEPWIGLWVLALVFAIVSSIIVTIVLPNKLGMLAILFDRQIDNTQAKIRLQTGFTDEIVDILTMPNAKLAQKENQDVEKYFRTVWDRTIATEGLSDKHVSSFDEVFDDNTPDLVRFRLESLYPRIKEFFSDFVVKEIVDTLGGREWRSNHLSIFKGLRLYMAHHFTEKYSNNVTGLAYGGAAFLIVAVGIRGLKFIPSTKPSFILLAISLEFSMLMLMATTLIYTEEEERMDKLLKKMEDANRSQLEALKGQQYDIHLLTDALVGQTAELIKTRVEKAITEYMTSDDKVKQMIAEEISDKILTGLKGAFENPREVPKLR